MCYFSQKVELQDVLCISCSCAFSIHLLTPCKDSNAYLFLLIVFWFKMIFQDGILNAAPYLSYFFFSIAAGPIVDFILMRRWLSVTATRKAVTVTGL